MRRAVESLLFDLDNTLIDRTGAFYRFCIELYRSNDALRGTSTEAEAVALMVELDEDGLCDRHRLFEQVISKWPGAFRDEDEAVEFYMRRFLPLISLDPRTRCFLNDLKSRGFPLGIVTNGGSEAQWAKVRSSGLEQLVDHVIVSGDLGIQKPNPGIFEFALAKMKAKAESTLLVGDNPTADILGALGMGMVSAWIRLGRDWPFNHPRPDYIIDHVWEASEIVFG
ncbi:MAG: HAD-IA family hydrolase [Chloroflexi bacterium]|nr:HAD-IA family hydrolase [Chloroflexota bacterium]MCY3936839.1 HAD-IA family hydrolase [Chloroflexota bacterium]